MKAVFTTAIWLEVPDIEDAAVLASEMDRVGRLNVIAVLEQRGYGEQDAEGILGYLGTSFWVLDEDKVLG
jgi:hypothetical protein